MRYLILDGYISGTGIRDGISNEYLNLNELSLSKDLIGEIEIWKKEYYEVDISGKPIEEKKELYNRLDKLGIELSKRIQASSEYKVDYYFSDHLSKRIYIGS